MNANYQIFRRSADGVGQFFEYENKDAGQIGHKLAALCQSRPDSVFAVYHGDPDPVFTFQGHWNGNPRLAQEV